MRLLCLADLHDVPSALQRILAAAGPVDLVLLAGDLTNFGSPDDAERLIRQAETTKAKVLAVAGNCDSAAIDRRLVELGVSLAGRGLIHAGVGLHGLSAMPPWRGDMYEMTEDELAGALRAGHAQIDGAVRHVVLAHVPPRDGSLDCISLARHVGSTALRSFVDTAHPDLVVCGHVHESRGVELLDRTTVVNCGPAAAGFFAVVELSAKPNDAPKVELREV